MAAADRFVHVCRRVQLAPRRLAWSIALVWLAFPRPAPGQRAGDPTPGSLAPLVVIVTPANGAVVGRRIRVEARVQHPGGPTAIASVRIAVTGASSATVTMAASTSYAPESGAPLDGPSVYEAIVSLAPGASSLTATATDGGGRFTGSAPVAVTANDGLGDGNLLVRDNGSQLCASCHALASHGAEALGRTYGAWTTTCRDCHQPHGSRNLFLVRESITPPWLAGTVPPQPRPVRFSTRAGHDETGGELFPARGTFANGDGSGPCQVCHTRTIRWQAGGPADAVHRGDCSFCHAHRQGFRARCADCHAAPPATGAHAAHAGGSAPSPPFPGDPRPLGCGSCHPTDPARHGDGAVQVELNRAQVLPGGTSTSGSRAFGAAGSTSCLAACHFPLGAPEPPAPIAWSAGGGPLPCTSCHARIDPGGAVPTPRAGPSLHDPVFSEARPASGEPTTCWSCHRPEGHDAAHLTGDPALAASAAIDAACLACHRPPSGPFAGPEGQVLHRGADVATSRTPPPLPGWSTVAVDAAAGDFHGGRRGTCFGPSGPQPCAPGATPTGYGGTLLPPYARGQPALPCAACHAGHASQNAFLIAPLVNGVAIPPGAIDRTGVGAERLCEACHAGGRHDRCRECHTDSIICPDGQCYMDPAANHVDPAPPGSACFWCHGHEGILRWTEPYSGGAMNPPWNGSCSHCHGFGMPATRLAAPVLTAAPSVSQISATGASVAWRTDEAASSWVEYGVAQPGWVAGESTEVADHAVALTDLAPGTTYLWRVRSVDAFRNVLRTSLATFTTTAAGALPFPDVVPVGSAGATSPVTTAPVDLRWYPVASPTGGALEYRVELASDPAFASLVNGSPPDSGWIAGAPGTYLGRAILSFQATLTNLPIDDCSGAPPVVLYYWRVKARDVASGTESDWSAVDVFGALSWDPYGC